MTRDIPTELQRLGQCGWPGPDRNPRVEQLIKEQLAMQTMQASKFRWNRSTIAIIAAAALGGGALAAGVTHQIMSQRAILVADDGSRYEVDLVPIDDATATGQFITDDGTEYGIRSVQSGDSQTELTVDIDSDAEAGTSESATITIEGDADGG